MKREVQHYQLTYDQLLRDLHKAYYDARRHKRNKHYQKVYESRLELNLKELCDELWNREYKPRPSSCFIISDPKKREVFAAEFRDRIVHHLYYNYTYQMLERTFIADSYSCIKGRGTHFGIKRLEKHILQESQNYTEECYVLKMDISGYFMNINREKLLEICMRRLRKMMTHRVSKHDVVTWQEVTDMDFVFYLTREIILLDPTVDCRIVGDKSDWDTLPYNKSLFHSAKGCGLPIGNLTSQLFSNVYLGELDDYMKRILHCRHYGRYVDDFYVVSADKDWLHSIVNEAKSFLEDVLGLTLHKGKLMICNVRQGIEFLGAYLKPYRRYVSNKTLSRMVKKIGTAVSISFEQCQSFHGVLCHYTHYGTELIENLLRMKHPYVIREACLKHGRKTSRDFH